MLDDEDVGLEDPDDRAFAAALRREVAAWARPPDHLMVDPPIASSPFVAWMDVLADGSAILTIGVHVADGTAVGDELHSQLFLLPERPTSIRFQASGSPQPPCRADQRAAPVAGQPRLRAPGVGSPGRCLCTPVRRLLDG
ncbi:hypothetical protein [Oerskovia flava]|uniref:hypothetical protein n=1 Tax=Oerskovia flava TaxID=2986422 RepID=UPI00224052B2|nr:hypothetical protein [Oerskovia sp. JB1-3-2]